jgi:hypothetical protein
MPNIDAPKHIPITNDNFKPADYASVPAKVAAVMEHEPQGLRTLWDEIAKDGYVSPKEGRQLSRRIIRNNFVLDGLQTVNSTEAKFIAKRLAAPGVNLSPEAREILAERIAGRDLRMVEGKIFNGTFRAGDKLHTLTEGIIDMPYEAFTERMAPNLWAANLADYRGGDVKVTKRDERGRVIEQRERMITETPYSKVWYQLFGKDQATNRGLPNDMTKVESIVYDDTKKSVGIKWEVLASDNRTTLVDIGELRFRAHTVTMPDGSTKEVTKVEVESEHRIDAFPGTLDTLEKIPGVRLATQTATERIMRDYFTACVERYRSIGSGQAPVRTAP